MTEPFLQDADCTLYHGDVLDVLAGLPSESVDCCVTSPPYLGLRDYGNPKQIGLEPSITEFVRVMVTVFAEVRRVLRDAGTAWINIGDSYNAYNGNAGPSSKLSQRQSAERPLLSTGHGLQQKELKPKDLMMVPARVAIALQEDGWWLRSEIVWFKPNPMPESIRDRPTKAHEMVYLLSKRERYYFGQDDLREPYLDAAGAGRANIWPDGWASGPGPHDAVSHSRRGRGPDGRRKTTVQAANGSIQHRDGERWPDPRGRNIRDVWQIAPEPYPEAHFATFPTELARRCILGGCPPGGTVLDPFVGSGTTCKVARDHGRHSIGIDLNADYLALAARRLQQQSLLTEAGA